MTLQIENVTKKFGDFTAVKDLSMTVKDGSMYGFLGANGAGKTTTFRMILGLLDPTQGSITWNNKPITYANSSHIGYLPEERGLYPKMKVEDQLIYLGQLRGMKKQDAKKCINTMARAIRSSTLCREESGRIIKRKSTKNPSHRLSYS